MSAANFIDLPIDILELLFLHLDGISLGRLLLTCRRFSNSCANERYWKRICHEDFGHALLVEGPTWRQQYGLLYKKFSFVGIDVYKRIRSAWEKIERFFEANGSRIVFDDPLTVDDVSEFKNQLGDNFVLPNDYICSLMIHNGQKIDESVLNGLCSGAYGSVYAYEEYKTEFLASTMNVLIAQNHVNFNSQRQQPELSFVCLTIAVTNRFWSYSHLMCVTPDTSAVTDRKISFGGIVSAPQLRQRFTNPCWIVAPNYTDWLESYANALHENRFALSLEEPVTDDNELLRFYWAPDCEARSGPFSCRVATVFIPENSSVNPLRFSFAYRVTLAMDSDADEKYSCQLQSRHWVITDGDGKVERVDGPGVIGEFPVLKPGVSFSYVSCTFFPTKTGRMTGHFTMHYISPSMSSQSTDITCPEFVMEAPDYEFLKFSVNLSAPLDDD